jgi:ATP-dependent Clp endopeptidase proteolytic subunit ClpP
VSVQARDPQYRFWGRQRPDAKRRVPVLATVPPPTTDGEVTTTATMRLYGPIDSWGDFWGVSALEFLDALDQLPDTTSEIRLHINSPGGEVYEGIAILNALRNHPATVTAVVDGIAASAASFIAAGADEVVMSPNSELMIHDAWGITIGPAADHHQSGNDLDRISNNIASVYQAKAGGDVQGWRDAMLAESWYGADEAVTAGLADRVLGAESDEGDPAPEARARFDTQALFKHQNRTSAPPPPLPTVAVAAVAASLTDDEYDRRHRHNARKHGLN